MGLGIFLRKMAVSALFSKFDVIFLGLSGSCFSETFRDCSQETPCTGVLSKVVLGDPLLVLWGLKVAHFGKIQS